MASWIRLLLLLILLFLASRSTIVHAHDERPRQGSDDALIDVPTSGTTPGNDFLVALRSAVPTSGELRRASAAATAKQLRSRRRSLGRGRVRQQEEIIHTLDNTSTVGGGPFQTTGVRLTTTLPESWDLDSHLAPRGSCTSAPHESFFTLVTCDVGTLEANEVLDFSFFVTPQEPGVFEISAELVSDDFDPTPDDNATTIIVEVDPAPSSVQGQKYEDLNGNGQKDPDEPGVDDFTIVLTAEDGTTVEATTASVDLNNDGDISPATESGLFTFGDVAPGLYVISEIAQDGWSASTSPTQELLIEGGEELTGIEFGNYRPPTIIGRKFEDVNGNGSYDEGEPLLSDWTITLTGTDGMGEPVTVSVSTGTDGSFSFMELRPGTYSISEESREGWRRSASAFEGEVELVSNDQLEGADFGNYRPGSIHGIKFRDDDGDGIHDAGEPGLGGWTITLTGTDGAGGMTVTTNTNGAFSFLDLKPGTYTLSEENRAEWTQTAPVSGTHAVTLSSGQAVEGRDFGNRPVQSNPGDITGQKFFDADGDGIRDPGEAGVGGVVIELVNAAGAVVARQSTRSFDLDGDGVINRQTEQGLFRFADVETGSYTVREVLPAGWRQTAPGGNGTHAITISSGQSVADVLFGNVPADGVGLDWGDLPDPREDLAGPCPPGAFACYETLRANFGAAHVLGGDVWLGALVDEEMDGQPNATADGDDVLDGNDDEDGINSVTIQDGRIIVNLVATVQPPATQGFVDAWIDLDDDGEFSAADQIFNSVPVSNGVNILSTDPAVVALPPDARLGYARFRISSTGGLAPWGIAADGEVEDYFLLGLDFGDAPEVEHPDLPHIPAGYPTTLPQNGARHIATTSVRLGAEIDADQRGLPHENALGDDEDNIADEDGILFLDSFFITSITPNSALPSGSHVRYGVSRGGSASIAPLPNTSGKLDAWIDWNRDGDWEDDGEQIIASVQVSPRPEPERIFFDVPADASPGATFARFRFSRLGGLSFDGPAYDGEVEDYLVDIVGTTQVTDSGDNSDADPGDGICDDGTGQCSLRAAIEEANAARSAVRIVFSPAGKQGVFEVAPQSPLPVITAPIILEGGGVLSINGSGAGAETDGLAISGGNSVISGVTVTGFGGSGIVLSDAGGNQITAATITANAGDGIRIASGSRNTIRASRIFANGGLGIDLGGDGVTLNDGVSMDSAPNAGQDYAIITRVTAENRRIAGTFAGPADSDFTIDLFANTSCDPSGFGEGERFVGSLEIRTDAQGTASFDVIADSALALGEQITTTATSDAGNTSEFSACVVAVTTSAEYPRDVPGSFQLHPNYPNPFNPTTELRFDLPAAADVRLEVFNVLGRHVRTLVDEVRGAGRYAVTWDGRDDAGRLVSTGIYIVQVRAGSLRETRTVVLVK